MSRSPRTRRGLSPNSTTITLNCSTGSSNAVDSPPDAPPPFSSRWKSRVGSVSSRASASFTCISDERHPRGKEITRHRRVPHQGQDHPEVPGLEVHREGLHGPRSRSAQEQAGGGRKKELQARLPRPPRQEEGAGRSQEGGGEVRLAVHRH